MELPLPRRRAGASGWRPAPLRATPEGDLRRALRERVSRPLGIWALAVALGACSLLACAHDFGGAPEAQRVETELRTDDGGTLWLVLYLPGWLRSDTPPAFRVEVDGSEVVTRPVPSFVERTLRYRIASSELASSAMRVWLLPESGADAVVPLLGGGRAQLPLPQALNVAEATPLPAAPAAPDARALQTELVQGCGCHFDVDRETRSLELAELRWTPSLRDPARLLVEPGRADRSLLVHVLLDGYPDRAGVAMPPPWAEAAADGASVEALAVGLVRWIEAGAPVGGEAESGPTSVSAGR